MDIIIENDYARFQMWSAMKQLKRVLDKLPEGTQAYIAGGVPRDWHHGWGCRDVDIFYKTPMTEEPIDLDFRHIKLLGEGLYYHPNNHVLSVHEYPVYNGALKYRKVQLIRTDTDPLEVIKDFPINMSRIWMDRKGNIECDRWYAFGWYNCMLAEMHTKQYNYPYLEKILGRYRDYGFMPWGWKKRVDVEEIEKQMDKMFKDYETK